MMLPSKKPWTWRRVASHVDDLYAEMNRPADAARCVADFCKERQIDLSYEDFRQACYSVARRREIANPSFDDIRRCWSHHKGASNEF